jgi:hypothetical protein
MNASRYFQVVLTVIAVLLALNLWTAWTASPAGFAQSAYAQGTVNAAQQRVEMIDQLKKLNATVDRLDRTLTSGNLTVQTRE